MFACYVALCHGDAYLRLAELARFLEGVCHRISYPHVGKMEIVDDCSRLLTSDEHLNDHVLHLWCHMLRVFLVELSFCYATINFAQVVSKIVLRSLRLGTILYHLRLVLQYL